ncbi:MAG: carbohydrate-binding family 9-like protein [Caldilineaceae bacterium]
MKTLPAFSLPPVPVGWNTAAPWEDWPWQAVPVLPPLRLADDSAPAQQQTAVRVCYDATALYVRFDCDDRDIWGTLTQRDDPIYDEEVVEVFLAAGADTPTEYAEIELSPNGVLFDAWVQNPTGDRGQMVVDTAWDWPGIRWHAQRVDAENRWWGVLVLPWAGLGLSHPLPTDWRANFYRIERPRNGPAEYSCWSPTLTEPADFHKPGRFGLLRIG